ncbi:hypothetical protein SAMN04487894_105243 [Niabella drilacis]|uniref:Uncharacterized protein n=1 Tax=Niabella drilacis (strain DSM 25811 / CCM 8410 / CCUG 62505 / LMG 26954 / E90) TaxID=1285928 RepID=A0A1G6RF40_NIADE|nr:hypothetical protein SAMN04487894_105243 [Niabella drilacis]
MAIDLFFILTRMRKNRDSKSATVQPASKRNDRMPVKGATSLNSNRLLSLSPSDGASPFR